MAKVAYLEEDFKLWDNRYKSEFFNSLNGFKSVVLVGSKSYSNEDNVSIFSSIFHLGSNPACFGMIFRPDSVERHTLDNIRETSYYTMNHISPIFYQKAHQTSGKYPRAISEFDACGLERQYLNNFHAPFVKESSIKIGLKLVEEQLINFNQTILVVGEIVSVHLSSLYVGIDGNIDLNKADTMTLSGTSGYYRTELVERLPYVKIKV